MRYQLDKANEYFCNDEHINYRLKDIQIFILIQFQLSSQMITLIKMTLKSQYLHFIKKRSHIIQYLGGSQHDKLNFCCQAFFYVSLECSGRKYFRIWKKSLKLPV